MAACRAQFFDHTGCRDKQICNQYPDGQKCPDLKITQCPGQTVGDKEYCSNCIKIRGALAIKSPTLLEIVN